MSLLALPSSLSVLVRVWLRLLSRPAILFSISSALPGMVGSSAGFCDQSTDADPLHLPKLAQIIQHDAAMNFVEMVKAHPGMNVAIKLGPAEITARAQFVAEQFLPQGTSTSILFIQVSEFPLTLTFGLEALKLSV
jgi:hypothetical protein